MNRLDDTKNIGDRKWGVRFDQIFHRGIDFSPRSKLISQKSKRWNKKVQT